MISILHLHIADISLSLQFRQLDESTVTDYAYALSRGEELPDVIVAFDRETAWATEKSVIILGNYCILPKPAGKSRHFI